MPRQIWTSVVLATYWKLDRISHLEFLTLFLKFGDYKTHKTLEFSHFEKELTLGLFFFYYDTKWLWHERLYLENKILHLMFYYELKLYWMKVCWFYERPWIIFSHLYYETKFSNHLRIHCGHLEIQIIVPLSFF